MNERVYVEADKADAFARALLARHGVPKKDAAAVAGCRVRADCEKSDKLIREAGIRAE